MTFRWSVSDQDGLQRKWSRFRPAGPHCGRGPFFPGLSFILAKWVGDSDHPWGRLPFAEGEVRGVTAVYDKRVGVILKGVHPKFDEATRIAQDRPLKGIEIETDFGDGGFGAGGGC